LKDQHAGENFNNTCLRSVEVTFLAVPSKHTHNGHHEYEFLSTL